jgi:hypothetical protein
VWLTVVGRCFFSMKIISYNVRGLGGVEKRSELKRLVLDKKSVCCMFTRDKNECGG